MFVHWLSNWITLSQLVRGLTKHGHQHLKARLPRGNIAIDSSQNLPYWSIIDHSVLSAASGKQSHKSKPLLEKLSGFTIQSFLQTKNYFDLLCSAKYCLPCQKHKLKMGDLNEFDKECQCAVTIILRTLLSCICNKKGLSFPSFFSWASVAMFLKSLLQFMSDMYTSQLHTTQLLKKYICYSTCTYIPTFWLLDSIISCSPLEVAWSSAGECALSPFQYFTNCNGGWRNICTVIFPCWHRVDWLKCYLHFCIICSNSYCTVHRIHCGSRN